MGTIAPLRRRNGILYPLLLIMAVVVIVFSIIGIAVMTGVWPGALPSGDPVEKKSIQRDGKSPILGEPTIQAAAAPSKTSPKSIGH